MKTPSTVAALERLGRVQLSESFFMRDFLYSEISQIEGVPNIPDNPKIAIEAGVALCTEVLEPIQQQLGRISIRSAFRSCAVNAIGNEKKYSCARNESNYAHHIWDVPDENGHIGAMACIVVNRFLPYYEKTSNWTSLAWWVHGHVPGYSSMSFFPKLCAFNIGWHQNPAKTIYSFVQPRGHLTTPSMPNHNEDHSAEYQEMLEALRGH